jgi:type I restriction enzyme R subunit
MRNHTLMQTIARANRVFEDKGNGLIVDYVGVFRDLQRALAIYGTTADGGDGERPVRDKSRLVAALEEAVSEARGLCNGLGIDTDAILAAQGFARVARLDDAVEAILVDDETKGRYLALATRVARAYKAVLPDTAANGYGALAHLFAVLAAKIASLTPEADISEVMGDVEKLLESSIATEGYVIHEPAGSYNVAGRIDLSRIDFAALKARFEAGRKRATAERLRGIVNSKLKTMVRLNRSRADYLERFQHLIEEYNSGAANVEQFFAGLMAFADQLDAEEKRTIAERLSEEELVVFDLLTKPEPQLTDEEKDAVKRVARDLLAMLKREKLVLDWRKRQQSRAQVRTTIETMLDQGLPATYTPELYQRKCDAVYQHVFDSYYGQGRSIYGPAA